MSKKQKIKKIVHVVSSLNVGGAERFVLDLCKLQQKDGCNVAILSTGSKDDTLLADSETSQIETLTLSKIPILRTIQGYFFVRDCDVLHLHSPHTIKILLPFFRMLKACAIIYTRHGARSLQASHWKTLHIKMRKFVKGVSFVSNEGKDIFLQTHHWQGVPIQVIDNGVDLSAVNVRVTRSSNKKLKIGSVGRMVALKSQITLLTSLASLERHHQQEFEVHFFGSGDCQASLQQYHQEHIPDINVVFHGMVSDRGMIYNEFDILCVTSETEGLSLAIIEAMAYERAVIATNVGGNPKLVEHDATGWLFEYQDDIVLSEHLIRLLEHPEDVATAGKKGREKVEKEFSLKTTAEKYYQLYDMD